MTAEVRLGDWRDVLPGTYDPARAVVITDPPFGIGRRAYVDTIPWAEHVRATLDLPAARHVIRGPASLIARMDVPAPRRLIVEAADFRRRSAHRPGSIPYLWHGWLVYGRLRIGRRPHVPTGDVVRVMAYDDTHGGTSSGIKHDATTPYHACTAMLDMWVEPGWTVVDPYAGIGTIGQACRSRGVDYIGAEIDPRWHRSAVARIGAGAAVSLGL